MAGAKRAVAAYYAAVRAMDCQAFAAIFADDALTFDPDTASPVQGHGELQAFFRALCSHFERLNEVEDGAFFAHDGAAVKWTAYGVLSDGRGLVFEGIDVFEVNEQGRIQTLWTYRDPLPFPPGAGAA
jgi:steroid delta-isomerase